MCTTPVAPAMPHNPAMTDPAPGTATPTPRKQPKPSLRERVNALRNLPPFLREIWATSKPLAITSMGLRLVRALLPVVTLYIGKLIIDEAVRLVGLGLGVRLADAGLAGRTAQPPAVAARDRVRTGDPVRPARPHGQLCRQPAVGTVHQRHQRAPDGARGDARPRGFRGPGTAGQARPRAPPDDGPHEPDEPVVRAGAGRDHRGQLRRRPARLRAVADRVAGDRADPGLHRRGALQRAELFAELPVDAGATPARIPAPDRRQRRDREGGEDLQPPPLLHRALSRAVRHVLPGQPQAGAAAGVLGHLAGRARHARLLRRLRLHRLAHGDAAISRSAT